MSAPLSKINLPPIEMPVLIIIMGKCSDFLPFINLFNSLIDENRGIDNVQKLYYLRSYLRDESLDLIKKKKLPLQSESYPKAIQLLNDRYNNKLKITNEHINALLDLKPLSKSTASSLREFISTVKQELAALSNLDPNVQYWDAIILCILSSKLDMYTSRAYQLERNTEEEPKLVEFLGFLEKRALALENAEPGYIQHRQPGKEAKEQRPGPASRLAAYPAVQESSCLYCKYDHKLYLCKSFKLLPVAKRVQFVKEKALCNICLGSHTKKCKYHFRCGECKKAHNTLLHDSSSDSPPSAATPASLAANINNDVLLPTVKVKLLARDGSELHFKALLDSGSQLSFISEKAVQLLDLKPLQGNVNVVGITNAKTNLRRCLPIDIYSLNSPLKVATTCHVVSQITCNLPQKSFNLNGFDVPKNIKFADPEFNVSSEIDLLMGADVVFQVLLPSELPAVERAPPLNEQPAASPAKKPTLINTQFGYIIGGTLPQPCSNGALCNKVAFICTCETTISDNLNKFWKVEDVPQIYNEVF